jgi:hypothetical protein
VQTRDRRPPFNALIPRYIWQLIPISPLPICFLSCLRLPLLKRYPHNFDPLLLVYCGLVHLAYLRLHHGYFFQQSFFFVLQVLTVHFEDPGGYVSLPVYMLFHSLYFGELHLFV